MTGLVLSRAHSDRERSLLASSLIDRLVVEGRDDEAIEREVLRRQHELIFDLPVPHQFWAEGIWKEVNRIRFLVSFYLRNRRTIDDRQLVGVQVFEDEAPNTFPDGKNIQWFSSTDGDVPQSPELSSRVWWVRSRRFDELWSSVRLMAFKIARKMLRHYSLGEEHLSSLIQEACIATWKAQRTFRGGAKFSTYAHRSMQLAMLNLVKKRFNDRHTPTGLAVEVVDDAREDAWLELVEVLDLCRSDPDRCDVVRHALGFTDEEIGRNARRRRSRTRADLRKLRSAA